MLRKSRAGRERRRPQRPASRAESIQSVDRASDEGETAELLHDKGDAEDSGGLRRTKALTGLDDDGGAYGSFEPPSKAASARLQRSNEKAAAESEKENRGKPTASPRDKKDNKLHTGADTADTPKRTIRHREAPPYSDVMRVTILSTGPLEPVEWLCSPIVRLHLVSQETGEYVRRSTAEGEVPQLIRSGLNPL